MKRLGTIFAAAIVAAVIGFCLVSLRRSAPVPAQNGADLNWLRTEFALDDAQFATIRALHENYSATCARHCGDIASACARRDELRAASVPAAEVTAAEKRITDLTAVCNDATRAHLRRVAAAMSPAQGERFLRTVEPHLAQLPHDGERALRP